MSRAITTSELDQGPIHAAAEMGEPIKPFRHFAISPTCGLVRGGLCRDMPPIRSCRICKGPVSRKITKKCKACSPVAGHAVEGGVLTLVAWATVPGAWTTAAKS